MENTYEKLLREIEDEPKKHTWAGGMEIWRAILSGCERIPESLRHTFVVQVLVSILDDQEISNERLQRALREASQVQRAEESKRYRQAA